MTTDQDHTHGANTVDFLCIGAQKCGTTFVDSALRAHPDIQIPASKELHFFSARGEYKTDGGYAQCNADRDVEWYKQQFIADDRKKGEISTHYIFDPESAARIRAAFPDMRVFAVLRHPVKRAFSQYNMERYKTCKESRSLKTIIEEEPGNEILARGLYAKQVSAFLDQFPDDQLRIYLFEDMTSDPASFFKDLFEFIGVNPGVVPPAMHKRMNTSRKVRFAFIPRTVRFVRESLERIGLRGFVRAMNKAGAAKQLRKFNNRYNQVPVQFDMSPDDQAALQRYYADDIAQLERLLNRDLSAWKSAP